MTTATAAAAVAEPPTRRRTRPTRAPVRRPGPKLTDERLADPDINPDGYLFAAGALAARQRGDRDTCTALRNAAARAYDNDGRPPDGARPAQRRRR